MTDGTDEATSPAREGIGGVLVSIGQAAAILDAEFGGVSISKIRFWESRGLIAPVRTRGGSRRYSREDLDRLRTILTWQRRDFLPLDVIIERLGPDRPDVARSDVTAAEHALRPRRSAELTETEFLRRCLCPADVVEEMTRYGLLHRYDSTGLDICEIVSRLREHGIEPRHLRWLRQAAERQAALVHASVPARPDASAETIAEIDGTQRRIAADLTGMLTLLVRAALDDDG